MYDPPIRTHPLLWSRACVYQIWCKSLHPNSSYRANKVLVTEQGTYHTRTEGRHLPHVKAARRCLIMAFARVYIPDNVLADYPTSIYTATHIAKHFATYEI